MNKKLLPTQIIQSSRFRGPWRLVIIKTTRQDKQQNQITTTKFNNIQN